MRGFRFTVLAILLTWCVIGAVAVYASPFVISDPLDVRATHCGWQMDATARVDFPVFETAAGNICRYDLAGIAGAHVINATAWYDDAIYGHLESVPSLDFSFAVAGGIAQPAGLRIVP